MNDRMITPEGKSLGAAVADRTRVATYVAPNGEPVDFHEGGRIGLFERTPRGWELIDEAPLSLELGMSLAETKAALRASIGRLRSCELFLVRSPRGITRTLLEDAGFRVWLFDGSLGATLAEQLDGVVRRDLEAAEREAAARAALPRPSPVGDPGSGSYRIDLIELLMNDQCHASLDVLMPFFETVSFRSLEVVCDHMPKWFARELKDLELTIASDIASEPTPGSARTLTVVPSGGGWSTPPGPRPRRASCSCGG